MNAFDDVKINLSVLPPSSCAYAAIQLISMTAALPRIQRQRVIHPCRLLLHRPRIKLYDEDTREAECDQTRSAAGVGLPATFSH